MLKFKLGCYSKATVAELYIMNRSLTSWIQSHIGSRGSLNDPMDDLLAKEELA